MVQSKAISTAWWTLRIGLGVGPIVAGLDKFTNLLTRWEMYLAPPIERMLPMSGATFMHIVGVVEILAGILVLSRWTRWGGYVVAGWLIGIALNLVMTGMFFDLAVRDLEIALGAFALAKLSEARDNAGN